ncbi:MAG: ATP-binding protein [Tannerella sp.]|jgi:predicted ATPase|nr:ATP-binding protein [Tannerella sp.]
MARIIVENFGAIKSADINIKKYNFYIGETSSGKSTMAKLITIFNSSPFYAIKDGDFKSFFKLLDQYNIGFKFAPSTIINYENGNYSWYISNNIFRTNNQDADLMGKSDDFIEYFIRTKENNKKFDAFIKSLKTILKDQEDIKKDKNFVSMLKGIIEDSLYNNNLPIYIPAERLLISTFTNNIFTLLQSGASIPECIKEFGRLYENARVKSKNLDIDILDIKVEFSKDEDKIIINQDNAEIKFSQASSGIQTLIPLWTVLNEHISDEMKQIIVIEEPELNLYPSSQCSLIEWIMRKLRKSAGSIIVLTTHSPYVLSTIDNLVYAQEIIEKSAGNINVIKKINKLIPSKALIRFDEVSSSFFDSDGMVTDIRDEEMSLIGSQKIDGASNRLNYIFDELSKIEDELQLL